MSHSPVVFRSLPKFPLHSHFIPTPLSFSNSSHSRLTINRSSSRPHSTFDSTPHALPLGTERRHPVLHQPHLWQRGRRCRLHPAQRRRQPGRTLTHSSVLGCSGCCCCCCCFFVLQVSFGLDLVLPKFSLDGVVVDPTVLNPEMDRSCSASSSLHEIQTHARAQRTALTNWLGPLDGFYSDGSC